jgi:signal transduction histidine kinase/ligand-binding sensor domain-containing protein
MNAARTRPVKNLARATKRTLAALYVTLLLLLLWATPASAQKTVQRLSQYGHTAWRTQDGLLISPNTIAQTKDGYLWIGTNNGLVRFDGVRFVPSNDFAGGSVSGWSIDTVLAASGGSLWIATHRHIARLQDGQLSTYDVPGRPLQFLEDDAGTIWFAQTRAGDKIGPVCSITMGKVQCHGKPEVPRGYANTLSRAKEGGFWIGAIGGLCRWTPGSPAICYLTEQLKPYELLVGVTALESAQGGPMWVGIAKSGAGLGLGTLDQGRWKPFATPELDGSTISVSSLLEDRNGSLWVGTYDSGLYRIHAGRAEHFGRADGLTSDTVDDLREDREGTLWVVTSNGVDALRPLPVSRYSMAEGLPRDFVSTALPLRDGTVWIGGRILSVVRNGLVVPSKEQVLFGNRNLTASFEDHIGRIWVGLDKTLNVYQGGTLTPISTASGHELGTIIQITETADHDIWVLAAGEKRRLLRVRGLAATEQVVPGRLDQPNHMAPDPRGGLWLGYRKGDLAFYRNDELKTFPADTISGAQINGLLSDSNGAVLAATSAGLLLQQNDSRRLLAEPQGLPCKKVHSVIHDRRGALWLKTECGFIEIQDAELQRWRANPDSKIHYRLLDATDGAQPGDSSFSPNAALAPDGRLWFANGKTASVIDPATIARNDLPPPVRVEEFVADRVSRAASGPMKLPAQTRDIEIRYTALSFIAPQKIKFQYQLEGRDRGWQDAGSRRQAFYNDLPPGAYRFRVKACNSDGVWNETGASIDFEIAPAYFQTAWFKALCVVLMVGLLYGTYIVRLRQVAARIRDRLAVKNTERERIARDLHDTLLQSTQGLILRFQAASNRIPESDPTRQVLDKALERADEVLAEGRDRVLGLRVPADPLSDLAQSLAAAGDELAQGRGVAFRTTVEGRPRQLAARAKHEAYNIGREALINAFRHAEAGSIEVQLLYADEDFRLRVRDDGRGIEPGALETGSRPGHWGLPGMRERAQQIEAQFAIWSGAAAGTEIELKIPAAVAYGPHALRSGWLGRLRARR